MQASGAGGIIGFVTGKVNGAACQYRPTETLRGNGAGEISALLLVVEHVRHGRGDEAGRDAVGGDAAVGDGRRTSVMPIMPALEAAWCPGRGFR